MICYKCRSGELDVFVHDAPAIDYILSQENYDCELFKLGSFSADSYGSALPRDKLSDLRVYHITFFSSSALSAFVIVIILYVPYGYYCKTALKCQEIPQTSALAVLRNQ